jgi:hypothetical protein
MSLSATNFLSFLQKTLEKMKGSIEIRSGTFDIPEVPMQRKAEEIRLDK